MMKKQGPDLSKVDKDQTRTVDWFKQYIRDPKSKKPNAKMPAFDDKKISETDLNALVEFLASLK
jgi:cbb3-type cytochrome oxidase cytochrome c subunit